MDGRIIKKCCQIFLKLMIEKVQALRYVVIILHFSLLSFVNGDREILEDDGLSVQ